MACLQIAAKEQRNKTYTGSFSVKLINWPRGLEWKATTFVNSGDAPFISK